MPPLTAGVLLPSIPGNRLREQIGTAGRGGLPGGTATIYDLARATGLSPSTVSRALRGIGDLSPGTVARVRESAARLRYRPNAVARSLALRVSDSFALMLPDIANPFFPALVKAVQLRARHHGMTVLLCNTEGVPEAEAEYLEMLASRQIQGVVAMGLAITADEIRRRVGSGMKIVALDRAAAGGSAASVQADHRAGGWMATDHLLQRGHRAIAHISGPAQLSVTVERWEGYRDRMRQARIDPGPPAPGDFTESSGHRAAQELIHSGRHFTALFCANDLMALGAISALRSAGLGVPAQISVVGFDDIELGRYAVPALTTIRQPLEDLARVAVDLLVGLLRGEEAPAPARLAVELVVRESTAVPPRPVAEKAATLASSAIAPRGGEDVRSREDF